MGMGPGRWLPRRRGVGMGRGRWLPRRRGGGMVPPGSASEAVLPTGGFPAAQCQLLIIRTNELLGVKRDR